MKIFQLTTLAMAMVAASTSSSSSVYANAIEAEQPYFLEDAIDIDTDNEVLVARGNACNRGTRDGRNAVRRLFNNDCNNALDRRFTRDVNRIRDRKFPSNPRNWRDRARNHCARKAIKNELDRIGRQCRNSGQAADDCNELGSTAATIIVNDSGFCRNNRGTRGASRGFGNNLRQFRRECRRVGVGSCQGSILNAARECGARLNLSQQSQLQGRCRREVNRLTGGRNAMDAM